MPRVKDEDCQGGGLTPSKRDDVKGSKDGSFRPARGCFVGSDEESMPFRNHFYLLFWTVLWGSLGDHRVKLLPETCVCY